MTSDSFTFQCPSCNAKLTLPTRLAGIVGPCPLCHANIQAPSAEALAAYAMAQQAAARQHPTPAPAPVPVPAEPPPAAGSDAAGQTQGHGSGKVVEPRQLPVRTGQEIAGKPISDEQKQVAALGYEMPKKHHRPGRLWRILLPACFILLAIALVAAIAMALGAFGTNPGKKADTSEQTAGGAPKPGQSQETAPPAPGALNDPAPPPLAQNGDNSAQPGSTPPPPATGASVERGPLALATLMQFLDAESFAERKPIIVSSHSDDELSKTCLAGKLNYDRSPGDGISTDVQDFDTIENMSDCYFTVRLIGGDGKPASYKVLVRIRGDRAPKVVVDPFLDLYGGRLKTFCTTPRTDSGKFFAVIQPAAFLPQEVPVEIRNSGTRFSVKLQNCDAGPNFAFAVVVRNSEVGKLLPNPNLPLPKDTSGILEWGKPKACMVVLQWNRDDPAKPYIELLDIPQMDWNP